MLLLVTIVTLGLISPPWYLAITYGPKVGFYAAIAESVLIGAVFVLIALLHHECSQPPNIVGWEGDRPILDRDCGPAGVVTMIGLPILAPVLIALLGSLGILRFWSNRRAIIGRSD